jgi:hypothetical protein
LANGTTYETSHYAVYLQPPVKSSLFVPNILLSTLFSNTLNLCSSRNIRGKLSNPYRTTGKIIVLYILIFTFLDSRGEEKMFWTEWYEALPKFRKCCSSSG